MIGELLETLKPYSYRGCWKSLDIISIIQRSLRGKRMDSRIFYFGEPMVFEFQQPLNIYELYCLQSLTICTLKHARKGNKRIRNNNNYIKSCNITHLDTEGALWFGASYRCGEGTARHWCWSQGCSPTSGMWCYTPFLWVKLCTLLFCSWPLLLALCIPPPHWENNVFYSTFKEK